MLEDDHARRRTTSSTTTAGDDDERRRQQRQGDDGGDDDDNSGHGGAATTSRRRVRTPDPAGRASRCVPGSRSPSPCSWPSRLAGAGLSSTLIERAGRARRKPRPTRRSRSSRSFASRVDPDTAAPLRHGRSACWRLFLAQQRPRRRRAARGWWTTGGSLPVRPAAGAQPDPAFQAAVEENLERRTALPGWTSRFGEVLVDVQTGPGHGGDTGALVVVTFLDDDPSDLNAHDAHLRDRGPALAAGRDHRGSRRGSPAGCSRRCATLRETAEEISETDLSRRLPVTGNDDITALTRTVNGMLDRLEEAFVGQRQFLDDAGHELRTPLTVLRGHLELLDPGDPRGRRRDPRAAARRDGPDVPARRRPDPARQDRAAGLPRHPAGEPGPTSPTRPRQGPRARPTGTGCSTAPARPRPMDEQRITQAVLAARRQRGQAHRPGDEVAIGSSSCRRVGRIWVRDTGPGVPAEDQRADLRPVRPQPVSAERRGIRARALDRQRHRAGPRRDGPRRGRRTHRGVLRDQPAAGTRPDEREDDGGGCMARILIIEDEARIASFVAKGLKADGHRTTVASDGVEGLDQALSGGFDLVVLDIGLPRLDGFELLDQLRAQGSRIPVIVLTARDSVADTVSALEGGADDYMPKPFRFAELLARVRLRLRQGGDQSAHPDDVLEAGDVRLDLRTRRATVGGQGGRALGAGVRAGRDVPPQRGPGALARAAARPRLGLRLRPRLQRRRRLRRLPAPQARAGHDRAPCAAWATASPPDAASMR